MRGFGILSILLVFISCSRDESQPVFGSSIDLRVSVESVEGGFSESAFSSSASTLSGSESAFSSSGSTFPGSTSSAFAGGVATRASGAFVSGNQIGLYFCDNRGLASSGNAANNAQFTFNGTAWQLSVFGNFIPSGSYLAYGYYPYKGSVVDAKQLQYDVKVDQSSGISDGDYLSWGRIKSGAPVVVNSASANPIDVELTFVNRLSHIVVKGNLPTTYNNRPVGDVTSVKLLNTAKSCKLNLESGSLTVNPYSDKATITMNRSSYTAATKSYEYAAVAIPDTILPSNPLALIQFTYNDGTGQTDSLYIHAPAAGLALKPNTRHTITASVEYLDCYTDFAFTQVGGTQAADIKSSSATPYTLSVKLGADWLTITGNSTTGYSVTASANTTTINRMGELTLTNGVLTRTIAVLQLR